tara:strand:+ start:1728 stop:1973 length:246 start_codon:yes stop_codon:yes gene_type:complete
MWMSYSSPLTVFTTLLAMTPTLGANIYFFLLIFLMIDRRDEYMLVQFILCAPPPARSLWSSEPSKPSTAAHRPTLRPNLPC